MTPRRSSPHRSASAALEARLADWRSKKKTGWRPRSSKVGPKKSLRRSQHAGPACEPAQPDGTRDTRERPAHAGRVKSRESILLGYSAPPREPWPPAESPEPRAGDSPEPRPAALARSHPAAQGAASPPLAPRPARRGAGAGAGAGLATHLEEHEGLDRPASGAAPLARTAPCPGAPPPPPPPPPPGALPGALEAPAGADALGVLGLSLSRARALLRAHAADAAAGAEAEAGLAQDGNTAVGRQSQSQSESQSPSAARHSTGARARAAAPLDPGALRAARAALRPGGAAEQGQPRGREPGPEAGSETTAAAGAELSPPRAPSPPLTLQEAPPPPPPRKRAPASCPISTG
jgi:hypothetical protein